jgi:hypothetical protein
MKTLTLIITLLLLGCTSTINPGSYSTEQKYVDILLPEGWIIRIEVDTIVTGDEIIKFYHPIIPRAHHGCPHGHDGDPGPDGIDPKH